MERTVEVLDAYMDLLGEMTCTLPRVIGSSDPGDGLLVGGLQLRTGATYWLRWGPANKKKDYRIIVTGNAGGSSGYFFTSYR